MNKRKKLILAAVAVLALISVALLVYALFPSTNDNENNNTQLEEKNELGGINLRSTSELEAIDNPEERFNTYLLTAGDAEFQGKFEEALSYYKAAATTEGVNEDWRKQNLLRAYYLAKEINDSENEKYFLEVVGQELIDENESIQEELKKLDGRP